MGGTAFWHQGDKDTIPLFFSKLFNDALFLPAMPKPLLVFPLNKDQEMLCANDNLIYQGAVRLPITQLKAEDTLHLKLLLFSLTAPRLRIEFHIQQ